MELILRGLLALALLGPPLIGVIAPVLSIVRFRKTATRRPSPVAATAALLVWIALSVGAALFLQYVAFTFAWMWAHVRRPPYPREALQLLGYVGGSLLLLSACGVALHRFVIAKAVER